MIIFTDIDDTLMKTKRKLKDFSNFPIGAYEKSGDPLCYIDPSREKIINFLMNDKIVIPVTARSFEALCRVQLNFNHEKVINFGAHILDSKNEIVQEWNDSIQKNQQELNIFNKVKFIKAEFKLQNHIELIERIEFDTFVFFNFRNSNLNLNQNMEFSKSLEDFLNTHNINNFYMYITDRDVTLIPNYIKKEFAVEFLLKKYSTLTSVGVGDHKNDYSFMHLCDFSLFPNDSTLAKLFKVEK